MRTMMESGVGKSAFAATFWGHVQYHENTKALPKFIKSLIYLVTAFTWVSNCCSFCLDEWLHPFLVEFIGSISDIMIGKKGKPRLPTIEI